MSKSKDKGSSHAKKKPQHTLKEKRREKRAKHSGHDNKP